MSEPDGRRTTAGSRAFRRTSVVIIRRPSVIRFTSLVAVKTDRIKNNSGHRTPKRNKESWTVEEIPIKCNGTKMSKGHTQKKTIPCCTQLLTGQPWLSRQLSNSFLFWLLALILATILFCFFPPVLFFIVFSANIVWLMNFVENDESCATIRLKITDSPWGCVFRSANWLPTWPKNTRPLH